VGNQGPSDAQNVVLAGNMSLSGLEYSRDSGITWNIWNGSINLGNLVSGNLETILVRGKVASSTLGTLTGTATVTSDTTDANTQNNIFSENTTINTLADLSIIGTDNPDPVIVGENLTYSITASNNGPSDALNVTLTGNIALENIEYSLDNGNTWIGSLNIGTIITGSSKIVLIRGKVPSSTLGSFTSTWNVNSNTEDLNLANNAFTEVTTVNTLADLSIKIADSQDPALNGGKLNYAVLISNNGPSNAQNVKLTGNIPLQDIIYSLNKGITWNLWTGSLNLGNITSGNSTLILFSGKVSHSASSTLNCTLSVNSDIIDPDTGNNIASELTVVSTRAEFNQDLKDDYKGNGKSNCGPKALIIALSKLGAVANAEYIALVAGTNNTGTSFYGLVQAVKNLGLNLTGLKLDAEQLKPFDIVLLNFNGTGHYSVILSITNDKVVLSDPTFGIITISKADFLKLYTGYALTFNPDGRGTPLTTDQMKNLTGGNLVGTLTELGLTLTGMGAATSETGVGLIPLAIGLLILAGVGLYNANEYYSKKYPELNKIPPLTKIGMGVGLDVGNWLAHRKQDNPYDKQKELNKMSQGDPIANAGTFIGKLWPYCDKYSFPYNYLCKAGTISLLPGVLLGGLIKSGFTTDNIVDLIFNGPSRLWNWLTSHQWKDYKPYGTYTINDTKNMTFKTRPTIGPRTLMINTPGAIYRILNNANLGGWINNGVKNIKNAVKTVGIAVTKIAKTGGKIIKTVTKTIKKVVTKVVHKVAQTVKKAVTKVAKTISKAVNKVVNTAKQVVNTVKNTVSSGWNWLKGKIGWR